MATVYVDGEPEDRPVEVAIEGGEGPWVEIGHTVVLGVSDDRGVYLVFPSIEAICRWIQRAIAGLQLETWVQGDGR